MPVSRQHDGGPAYGGTPSDATVDPRHPGSEGARPQAVFYPFILMDIAGRQRPARSLWRRRAAGLSLARPHHLSIRAPGRPGTRRQDGGLRGSRSRPSSARAATVRLRRVGRQRSIYSGPASGATAASSCTTRSSARLAGGVDAFLIGTELRGLTHACARRASSFPFVAALRGARRRREGDPRPDAKITYAADWSEYFGHQPADGTGDVFFHLDPLWASPTSTSSASTTTCRSPTGATGRSASIAWRAPLDLRPRLSARPTSPAARASTGTTPATATAPRRSRTPITDGAYGKPWVFRYKDLQSLVVESALQPAGRRRAAARRRPGCRRSKPIWFTEIGCPAVDKGANQPNVFVDPKSSESLPAVFLDAAGATT